MCKDTKKILSEFKNKKIAVVGDLMLDHYLWGQTNRISPEAPVPIVDLEKEEYRLGGAANVVNNIVSLEAKPIVIGLIGDDGAAGILIDLLQEKNIVTNYIIRDNSRPTTVKSRIFASGQQVIRYDFEKRHEVSSEIEDLIIEKIDLALNETSALIIEDYNKGLLTPKIIRFSIEKAKKLKIPVTIDPKFHNFFEYEGCTLFKPNLNELKKNLGLELHGDTEIEQAIKVLYQRIKPEYLIVTLGEKGLLLFDKDHKITKIPTFAKEIFDVSGAGDTVISVITICLACALDIETSAIIANHAAGAVCGKRGIHPATAEDILNSMKYNM